MAKIDNIMSSIVGNQDIREPTFNNPFSELTNRFINTAFNSVDSVLAKQEKIGKDNYATKLKAKEKQDAEITKANLKEERRLEALRVKTNKDNFNSGALEMANTVSVPGLLEASNNINDIETSAMIQRAIDINEERKSLKDSITNLGLADGEVDLLGMKGSKKEKAKTAKGAKQVLDFLHTTDNQDLIEEVASGINKKLGRNPQKSLENESKVSTISSTTNYIHGLLVEGDREGEAVGSSLKKDLARYGVVDTTGRVGQNISPIELLGRVEKTTKFKNASAKERTRVRKLFERVGREITEGVDTNTLDEVVQSFIKKNPKEVADIITKIRGRTQ